MGSNGKTNIPESTGVEYSRLVIWGAKIVGWAKWAFFASLLLNIASSQLAPLISKVLEAFAGALTANRVDGPLAFIADSGKDQEALVRNVVILFALTSLLYILVRLGAQMVSAKLAARLECKLQSALHDKLLTLGPDHHEQHKAGEHMTIITDSASCTVTLIRNIFTLPLAEGAGLVTGLYWTMESLDRTDVPWNWRIFLAFCLVLMPVAGFLLSRTLREAYYAVQKERYSLRNELLNTLEKPLETQLMNAVPQRAKTYRHRLKSYFQTLLIAQYKDLLCSNFQFATVLIMQILFVTVAVYSTLELNGKGSLLRLGSTLIAFITLIPQVCAPIQTLIGFYAGLQVSWPSALPVLNLLEAKPQVEEKPGAANLIVTKEPQIELRNLSFGYDRRQEPVLNNLSHVFEPGKTTAIVASSGEGKTTLFRLITRLYDPWSGSVRVNGHDIRDVSLSSLRETMFVVSQFPMILEDSVRNNFLLAKPNATDREIRGIIEQIGLWDTLHQIAPDSELDLFLAKNDGLSGGERRRFALAQGLLRHPSVLLLDEPTTGLSVDCIGEVLFSLRRAKNLWPDTTILVIDHSMNFVRDFADQVITLSNGQFVEKGVPNNLLSSHEHHSPFRQLWREYNSSQSSRGRFIL